MSTHMHKWSLSFKQPVALLTGDEEENEPKFSLRAVEVQAVPVGFLGFGVGWLYNLQSYTHTAVRCRRAGGRRLGSNRKTGSSLWRQTNPVSLQFLQSHHFRAGYNLTARTQIKAVENNLGERSKLYLDGWFMILIDQLRSKLLNQMRSRLGEKKTSWEAD